MMLVKAEDTIVLAISSLTLELPHCQEVEFEVRDGSPGLRYTTPDGSKKWTPVVVNKDGRI